MKWAGNELLLLDQRLLPQEEKWLHLRSWRDVERAIRDMAVRGAPAIGVAAAYGMALAYVHGEDPVEAAKGLAASRPTAVNLFWALDRMRRVESNDAERIIEEARLIEAEDIAANRRIGAAGAELIQPDSTILTICNTGSLATAGHGTALGIIRSAYEQGKVRHVYACETRPRQQGLRLTAWELQQEGIPFHGIVDSAAGMLMAQGKISLAIAGADRIAANGDTANKVGTLMIAVLAKHFGVPFYIAAPVSTIDPATATGEGIPIEERSPDEVTHFNDMRNAPVDCPIYNPAFDVTPADLITAIVTESGVHRAPYRFVAPSLSAV